MYEDVIELISKKINGRKIAFRYKNPVFEEELKKVLGVDVDLRVTTNLDLIKSGVSPDSDIFYKSNEFLLVICPSWPWNKFDADRYEKAGYIENEDIIWAAKDHVLIPKLHEIVNDNKSNSVECHSKKALKTKFIFRGKNSLIFIGENTILPSKVCIYNDAIFEVGENTRILSPLAHLYHGSTISIGANCTLSPGVELLGDPRSTIVIGDSCSIGANTKIRPGYNGRISIGRDCMFSWDCVLIGHDEHLIYDIESKKCLNNSVGEQIEYVKIEDHVWLGGETVVLGGTHILPGVMAGYRSLIKGTIPNNTMVVGSPAKVVKKNIAWVRQNKDDEDSCLDLLDESYRCMTGQL